ncbi:helix-turn-helix domain-containing protein [Actinosynnema sp. NPDC002837]
MDGAGASSGRLTTVQAARRLGIAERSVRRAIQAGRLPATLLGSRWVLDPDDVEHFRARRTAREGAARGPFSSGDPQGIGSGGRPHSGAA